MDRGEIRALVCRLLRTAPEQHLVVTPCGTFSFRGRQIRAVVFECTTRSSCHLSPITGFWKGGQNGLDPREFGWATSCEMTIDQATKPPLTKTHSILVNESYQLKCFVG